MRSAQRRTGGSAGEESWDIDFKRVEGVADIRKSRFVIHWQNVGDKGAPIWDAVTNRH
jgi:hypothetical protein